MLLKWPPDNLNDNEHHILVTFGEPLTPKFQLIKLQSLLVKVSYENEWMLYIPNILYKGGCVGALFSTDDRAKRDQIIQELMLMKDGGKDANGGNVMKDNLAYTNIEVKDPVDADLKFAIDNDDVVEEYLLAKCTADEERKAEAERGKIPVLDELIHLLEAKDVKTKFWVRKLLCFMAPHIKADSVFKSLPYDDHTGIVTLYYPCSIPVEDEKVDGVSDIMMMWVYHIHWLIHQTYLSRSRFALLLCQYQVDDEIPEDVEDKCRSIVLHHSLKDETSSYGQVRIMDDVKEPLTNETYLTLMKNVYDGHMQWLSDQAMIPIHTYTLLRDLYQSDHVMKDDVRLSMLLLMGQKFRCSDLKCPKWEWLCLCAECDLVVEAQKFSGKKKEEILKW